MWVVFIFASLLSQTGYNIFLRRAFGHKKIDPLFLAAVMATAVALPGVVGLFVAKINWAVYDWRLWLIFAASVVTAALFHIVNAKALELTEASVFSVFFNFQIGFATLIGVWLLGEPLAPLRLVGGALVFAAGLVVAQKATVNPKGAVYSILTALLIAAISAFDKYMIVHAGLAEYVFPSKLLAAGVMWAIVFFGKRPVDKEFLKSRENVFLMCFRCVAAYGLILALALGALMSVTTYISTLTCVTIPIAAFLFLKETGSLRRKIIAAIIALAGVTFIFVATG
ncbi:MAG: DMT family transporter [Clostridiales bacterium]|nr:DMT family transporter [Clostridiales bacterium]